MIHGKGNSIKGSFNPHLPSSPSREEEYGTAESLLLEGEGTKGMRD